MFLPVLKLGNVVAEDPLSANPHLGGCRNYQLKVLARPHTNGSIVLGEASENAVDYVISKATWGHPYLEKRNFSNWVPHMWSHWPSVSAVPPKKTHKFEKIRNGKKLNCMLLVLCSLLL